MNRKFISTVWSLLAATAILCAGTPGKAQENKAQEKKPNIVFMLMDNLGYGELGVYGGGMLRGAPTPRIDRRRTMEAEITSHAVDFIKRNAAYSLFSRELRLRSRQAFAVQD